MSQTEGLFEDLEYQPTRTCILCKTTYPLAHFHRPGRGRNWVRCQSCRPADGTPLERQRQMGRDAARLRNLKRLYGITPQDYDDLRAAQEYRCAICHRHEDDLPLKNAGRPRLDGQPPTTAMKLHVDHDHETNAIRGLLCGACNSGIASFKDRADWMARAITYVTEGGVSSSSTG